ncbi:four-carbon acid sugar kinase family protein [Stomatohabitans albus]|uniref:four-carbon acid sugar kinase family protein n=1 Tax=Stomatohabitans albus TaxID=3110766 RepID=UPI00300D4250
MMDVLVIADDLTGANGTAAAFANAGMRTVTTTVAQLTAVPDGFNTVVASTDARHAPPSRAKTLVEQAIQTAWPARLVCNRIDTTMRGNIGATTEAVRSTVESCSGERTICVVAPAWPQAGRVTVEGHQLLHGHRLELTEVARDVRSPVTRSDIAGIISQQANVKAAHVPLSVITLEDNSVRDHIAALIQDGANTLIVDALTDGHLTMAMRGCVDAAKLIDQHVRWVTSDPGPGSVAMAEALGLTATAPHPPVVVLCGSASALTRTQLNRLQSERDAWLIKAPTLADSITPDSAACAQVLGQLIDDALPGQVVGLATAFTAADVNPLPPGVSGEDVCTNLATALHMALADRQIGGLYVSGGDVTAAVFEQLDTTGFAVQTALEPLCVGGQLLGGPHTGLACVTKGGLVGDGASLIRAVDYLHTLQTR